MTKKEMYMELINMVSAKTDLPNQNEILDKLYNEISILDNKKRVSSKKKDKENAILIPQVLEALTTVGKRVTVSELIRGSALKDNEIFTTSKVTVLLGKLVENEQAVRIVEKKKSYYSAIAKNTKE